jgi:hypothetical protein
MEIAMENKKYKCPLFEEIYCPKSTKGNPCEGSIKDCKDAINFYHNRIKNLGSEKDNLFRKLRKNCLEEVSKTL